MDIEAAANTDEFGTEDQLTTSATTLAITGVAAILTGIVVTVGVNKLLKWRDSRKAEVVEGTVVETN